MNIKGKVKSVVVLMMLTATLLACQQKGLYYTYLPTGEKVYYNTIEEYYYTPQIKEAFDATLQEQSEASPNIDKIEYDIRANTVVIKYYLIADADTEAVKANLEQSDFAPILAQGREGVLADSQIEPDSIVYQYYTNDEELLFIAMEDGNN